MNCIIVDDEPLARNGLQRLIASVPELQLAAGFSSAGDAAGYLAGHNIDLVFLDIQMPGINGLEFAGTIPSGTLVIFTTAYAEFALDSYDVDAIDYLVKPMRPERFQKAVQKALAYHALLHKEPVVHNIETISADFIFVKTGRRYFNIKFGDILYVEGLKDYVILHLQHQRLITAMNVKTISDRLPRSIFCRISKSYIINIGHISSFDNNTVMIGKHEIPIGNSYRAYFFEELVEKRVLGR